MSDHGDIEEGGPVLVLGTLREVHPASPDGVRAAYAVVDFPERGLFDHNVVSVSLDALRAAAANDHVEPAAAGAVSVPEDREVTDEMVNAAERAMRRQHRLEAVWVLPVNAAAGQRPSGRGWRCECGAEGWTTSRESPAPDAHARHALTAALRAALQAQPPTPEEDA